MRLPKKHENFAGKINFFFSRFDAGVHREFALFFLGKYKRFKASEAALNDPEARGGEPAAMPPGVPSHALRGTERTR